MIQLDIKQEINMYKHSPVVVFIASVHDLRWFHQVMCGSDMQFFSYMFFFVHDKSD